MFNLYINWSVKMTTYCFTRCMQDYLLTVHETSWRPCRLRSNLTVMRFSSLHAQLSSLAASSSFTLYWQVSIFFIYTLGKEVAKCMSPVQFPVFFQCQCFCISHTYILHLLFNCVCHYKLYAFPGHTTLVTEMEVNYFQSALLLLSRFKVHGLKDTYPHNRMTNICSYTQAWIKIQTHTLWAHMHTHI